MANKRLPIAGYSASLFMSLFFIAITLSLWTPLLVWVTLLCVCGLIVRVALYLGWYRHAPSVRTVNLLAVLSALALAWFSIDLGLLNSMVNLLVLSCSLKLLMLTRTKDMLQLFAAGLFLIGCGFIFSQSIAAMIFYSSLLLFLIVTLHSTFAPSIRVTAQLRRLGTMGIQALPIAILLFLVMPQLPPLWKMPSSKSSSTGLSEQVSPGDIASLIESDELVFNVTFDGSVPSRGERYWRAITLESFNGETWTTSQERKRTDQQYQALGHEFSPQVAGKNYRYDIIAEPTGQRWLYAMDIAVPASYSSSEAIWQSADYQLNALQPLMSKRAYSVISYPEIALNQTLITLDRRINLQLPQSGNPRTQAWVRQLVAQSPDADAFISHLLNYFAEDGFTYTLSPDEMPNHVIDTFLFDKKAGFCSHYASAMAYAMRLAGIPARLVTGYQGGEPLKEQVLTIRQYDAHAWVEAYLGDRGWVRFDPTSVVAPNRIAQGLSLSFGEQRTQDALVRLNQTDMFKSVVKFFTEMDYLWSKWVLGFNADRQQDLLNDILGNVTPSKLSLFFLSIIGLICGLLMLYFIPQWQRKNPSPHLKYYLKSAEMVGKYTGVVRENMAPYTYYQVVSALLPERVSLVFEQITSGYQAIEYELKDKQNSDEFKRQHRRLKKALAFSKRKSQ